MKRFLVFAGNRYYPDGGWGDFKGSFDTQSEAETKAKEFSSEGEYLWSHWVDFQTGEVRTVQSCWG